MAGETIVTEDKDEIRKKEAATEEKKKDLEDQIRKRVLSEERAYRIVEKLVDITVDMEQLKDMAHFLMPTHYKDIIEERAIAKVCGYPVCSKHLVMMKKQQYHISTKTNKVYDITERKNFCSNKCFKHSKIFENQLLMSPLWLRSREKPTQFVLPAVASNKGWAGTEVIAKKVASIEDDVEADAAEDDQEIDDKAAVSILDRRDWLDDLQESLHGIGNLQKSQSQNSDVDEEVDPFQYQGCEENDDNVDDANLEEDGSTRIKEMVISGLEEFDSDDASPEEAVTPPTLRKKQTPLKPKTSRQGKVSTKSSGRLSSASASSAVNAGSEKDKSTAQVDYLKKLLSQRKNKLSTFLKNVSLDSESTSSTTDETSTSKDCTAQSPVVSQETAVPAVVDSQQPIKDVPGSCSQKYVSSQFPRDKIIRSIHSWLTQESLRYLGLANIDEDADGTDAKDPTASSAAANSDFAKLCDRIDIQGRDFEILLDDHVPKPTTFPQKGLPSFQELQKETESYSLKVKEYYKPPPKKKVDDSSKSESEMEFVLPHVDSYSQISLRISIFLQQLDRRITSLISHMDILIGELSTEIKDLVNTLSLTSENIVLKPTEWNVAAVFLIVVLSRKVDKLKDRLQLPKVREEYNKVLQNFNLTLNEIETIVADHLLTL